MPSELEIAINTVAETEVEWKRVQRELQARMAARSDVIRQIKALGKRPDPNLLIDLLDKSRELDELITALASQKQDCLERRKRAKAQAKEVEKKAEDLRKMIRTIDEQLAPGGDLVRRIREAQHAVELQIRLREAAERERSGLYRQLQELIGSVGKAA